MKNNLLSVSSALSKILKRIKVMPAKEVPVMESLGLTLSESVFSKLNNPSSDVSSMDGYAVNIKKVNKLSLSFICIGESSAGSPFTKKVNNGECVRIFTGASIPKNCDAIVLQEDTLVDKKNKNLINFKVMPRNDRFIRKKGMDFKK